jgi:hypothetical protein
MTFLESLQIIACVGTIGVGVVSLFWPRKVQGFTGLTAAGGRGVTEIRAILGALFLALGALPLLLKDPAAYQMLGYTYLLVGVVRAVSIFVDKSFEQSNVISVITEIVFGVILVL